MNTNQLAAARAVIVRAQLLCDGALKVPNASERGFACCAMGELILAAGYTPSELTLLDGGDPADYPLDFPKLRTVFGIDSDGSADIVAANDDPFDVVKPRDFRAPNADRTDYDFEMGDFDVLDLDLPRARKAAVLATLDKIARAGATEAR